MKPNGNNDRQITPSALPDTPEKRSQGTASAFLPGI
jgi:hypothetical protein